MTRENILKILEKESIRLIDGRYATGFVDLDDLNELIQEGEVEVYKVYGVRFARLIGKREKH